jgi:hypothetical protein
MKTNQTAMALLISILITIISVSPGLAQSANQQKNLSVEGEWELISTNTTAIRKDIGQRLSISRQGDGYEVKWLDGRSAVTYSGNDTRIVHTFLEDLGKGGGSEGGPPIPASVLQQVTGQKAPIINRIHFRVMALSSKGSVTFSGFIGGKRLAVLNVTR